MKKDFAESFSLSFHPILIPFYSLVFLFVLPIFEIRSLGSQFQLYILLVVGITGVLLPLVSLWILKRQGLVSSYHLPIRKERFLPYVLVFFYYSISALMLYRVHYMPILIPLVIGIAAMSVLLLLVLNIWIKASAHAMGMASLLAMLTLLTHFYGLDLKLPMIVVSVLSIIVVLSRLELKAHTALELGVGYVLGLIWSIAVGYLVLNPVAG